MGYRGDTRKRKKTSGGFSGNWEVKFAGIMPPTYGKVEPFEEKQESFTQYVKRLNYYFQANRIEGDEAPAKKRAIFLTVVGPNTFNLLCDLISPTELSDKSYVEIITILKNHFNPALSEIVERFKFNIRNREEGESVAKYVSELRSLTKHCSFGATLDKMLRDRLVAGINNEGIQHKLFGEPAAELTFERAYKIAVAEEVAAKNTLDVRSLLKANLGSQGEQVHQLRTPAKECYHCGHKDHNADVCRFKDAECHYCRKKGHIEAVCRTKARSSQSQRGRGRNMARQAPTGLAKLIKAEVDSEDDETEASFTFQVATARPRSLLNPPLSITVNINNNPTNMEVDTGASVSLLSEKTFNSWRLKARPALEHCNLRLQTYTGEKLKVLGRVMVEVVYEQQQPVKLSLIIVAGDGPNLFGRNWLRAIRLDWSKIHRLEEKPSPKLHDILQTHETVFREELGQLKGVKATLHLKPEITPKFCKARSVPFAMKDRVDAQLQKLENQGIIEPVKYSEWAAPIVPILKADGESIRICGDFKLTANKAAVVESYPILKVGDLFVKLGGGEKFTKLDLRQAYNQLELDEASKKLVTISTHRGLYQYNRLPFGVASAPAIFQRTMEQLLRDMPRVGVYIDDILLTGANDEEHLNTLREVLRRLEDAGLRLRKDKCSFMQPSVVYLGHVIDKEGLRPTQERVKAVMDAPAPVNTSELKSYLCLLSYYGKFLRNVSQCLAPMHQLLHDGEPWRWEEDEEKAFAASKELLLSSQVLMHFDPSKPIVLATDASSHGIGAVLAHKLPDGSERPIAFASRTMSSAEKRYSQIEKEGLAIIFGLKKFRSYLLGSRFQLFT